MVDKQNYKVLLCRQNGFESEEFILRENAKAKYLLAEREIDRGVRRVPYNHLVAVFLYDEVGDLIEAYSIKGSM